MSVSWALFETILDMGLYAAFSEPINERDLCSSSRCFLAMPRACIVCGAEYLGGSVCSDRNCSRSGRRQRDLRRAWPRVDDVEAPPPVSQSPQAGGEASAVDNAWIDSGDASEEEEMAELRGLLHELLEVSTRIIRRFGVRALHREVSVLERVARVWGARYIRWDWRGQ